MRLHRAGAWRATFDRKVDADDAPAVKLLRADGKLGFRLEYALLRNIETKYPRVDDGSKRPTKDELRVDGWDSCGSRLFEDCYDETEVAAACR